MPLSRASLTNGFRHPRPRGGERSPVPVFERGRAQKPALLVFPQVNDLHRDSPVRFTAG
ncbi:MAG: hypothetical protein V9G20_20170 [Candidatus Promineifilaceae bacterium]